jgi:NAD(P)-dependent dehydrogenase (short-subunit alcohol dehydrogenase family)
VLKLIKNDRNMMDKTVLITGGNSGIGKETALGLARMNATILIVGRDEEKTERAVDEIRRTTGNGRVDYYLCDLSSLADVRKLASDFLSDRSQLDVLFNNAGAINSKRFLSQDGYELTFAVNHLAHFLLTDLLLDALKRSSPSRIITTSSTAAKIGHMHFDDLMLERNYIAFKAYGQSKLANQLFTFELARRLHQTGVTANCLHPGIVRTGFAMNNSGALKTGMALLRPFIISAKKAAETPIYLASSPEVQNVTGKYFEKKTLKEPPKAATDLEAASRLWEISEKLVKKDADQ